MRVKVNGFEVEVPQGISPRGAALAAGFRIPGLCNMNNVRGKPEECGLCTLELDGWQTLACRQALKDGSVIETTSREVLMRRAAAADALDYEHFEVKGNRCHECAKRGRCEFMNVTGLCSVVPQEPTGEHHFPIQIDAERCVACGRCAQEVCQIGAFTITHRPEEGCPIPTIDVDRCIACGQCIKHCPTGTLSIHDVVPEMLWHITDPNIKVWWQYAPGILPGLAVHYKLQPGEATHELMYAILARMNSGYTIPTHVGADIITIEESDELLGRVTTNTGLPLITSCCPGHMNLLEQYSVDIMPHVSTCHSPQEAIGALMHHEQEKPEHAGHRHINVSVMPCTAKNGEAKRFHNQNVDLVVTTTQFIRLIEVLGIDVHTLVRMQKKDKLPALDTYPLAIPSSGGAVIFARSGGVTEAVLRYLGHKMLDRPLGPGDLQTIQRNEIEPGIVLTELTLGEVTLKALVARGGKAALRAYEMVANGEAKAMGVVVVEVMICPHGCITGGGQPCREGLDALARKLRTLQKQDHVAPTFDPIGLEALERMMAELGEKRHAMFHRHDTAH